MVSSQSPVSAYHARTNSAFGIWRLQVLAGLRLQCTRPAYLRGTLAQSSLLALLANTPALVVRSGRIACTSLKGSRQHAGMATLQGNKAASTCAALACSLVMRALLTLGGIDGRGLSDHPSNQLFSKTETR